jgi:hypothetical protein
VSTVLDDGLRVITRDGGPVPFEYQVSEDGTLTVESAFASFDGSAAAAYLPCIAFYSQSGALLGRYFPTTGALAAGTSADVSFAPFLGDGAGGSTATGLAFDTFPQTGTWFYAEVDGAGGPNGWGMEWADPNGNGMVLNGVPVDLGDVNESNNGAKVEIRGSGVRAHLTGAQSFEVCLAYNGTRIIEASNQVGAGRLGFFGHVPVVKQATPVTLADVIALLQAYGLAV